MEDRVTELETRLAFQEELIRELNEVVTRQQQQIDDQRKDLATISQRLEALTSILVAEDAAAHH